MVLAQSDLDVDEQRQSMKKDSKTFKRKKVSSCLSMELEKAELETADLSSNRVTPDQPPFTHVGVYYFGLF